MYSGRARFRSRSRRGYRAGSGVNPDVDESHVVWEVFRMFTAGVPIALIRLVYLILMTREITGKLEGLEVFAGSASIVNAMRFFRRNAISYEIMADAV